jgi:hypothetical protein
VIKLDKRQTDLERAKFRRYMANAWPEFKNLDLDEQGDYKCTFTSFLWKGWVGRAIELKEYPSYELKELIKNEPTETRGNLLQRSADLLAADDQHFTASCIIKAAVAYGISK